MNQKHRQEIDDRCGKDHAVEAVENTAVARNQLSVILDALISFDCGCRKISDHGDQRADTADDGVFHHAALCRSRIDDAEQNRSDDTADSSFYGFFRA